MYTDGYVKLIIDVLTIAYAGTITDVNSLVWPDFKLTHRTPYHLQLRACAV